MSGKFHLGLLNTYLELQSAIQTSGSAGGQKLTWSKEANIWADLRHSSSQNEVYEASQKVALDKSEATIYKREIKPGFHRLKDGGRIYDILGVVPVENREAIPGQPLFIKLLLEEKDNTGG